MKETNALEPSVDHSLQQIPVCQFFNVATVHITPLYLSFFVVWRIASGENPFSRASLVSTRHGAREKSTIDESSLSVEIAKKEREREKSRDLYRNPCRLSYVVYRLEN